MLVMLLGQTRVLVFDGQRRAFAQEILRRYSPRFRTPWKNTMLVGLLAAIVGSLTPIDDIGKMVNIGTLLAFVIVCIAVMALRHTNPGQPRPFRTPWVPFVPVMGILFNGYMMYKLGWINWARLIIWLIIGLVVYFTYSRKHSRVQAALEGRKTTCRDVACRSHRCGVCGISGESHGRRGALSRSTAWQRYLGTPMQTREPVAAGLFSWMVRVIAVTRRRGEKRTDCASSQFLNPKSPPAFQPSARDSRLRPRCGIHRSELQQSLAGAFARLWNSVAVAPGHRQVTVTPVR
jgi:hypothetical protein